MISVRECSRSLKIVSVPASASPLTLLAVPLEQPELCLLCLEVNGACIRGMIMA